MQWTGKKESPVSTKTSFILPEDTGMKKSLLMTVVFTLLFMLSSVVMSFAEEADDFRGMRWGTPIAEIRKTHELVMTQATGKDQFVYYSIVNDNLRFEGVMADSIRYFFWKDRFTGVVIVATGKDDFDLLKGAAEKRFGLGMTGIGPSGEEVNVWEGEATMASLSREKTTGKTQLVLFSKMIHELKEGLEAEKADVESEKE
jgi:hypothetical protein